VDDIPPSCPVYNVRYVYVYDTTPDVVYMGYLPGYVGCYPYYGTVVYGTGYRYKPWRGRHHYYPRPTTWGFHPRYNPWLSRWSFGFSYSTPFLRVGTRWRSWQQPTQHHTPPLWFGPGGYRRPMLAGDLSFLRTRRPGSSRLGLRDRTPANLYHRPENIVRIDRTALSMPARRITRPVPKPVPMPNNLFAGKDGRVYQRDDRGKWKVNEGRTWKPARVPLPPISPPPAAGGGPGSMTPGAPRPVERPPAQPAPGAWPTGRQVQPRTVPATRPMPPMILPEPGNLELEFRARERAGQGASSGAGGPMVRPARALQVRPKGAP
jgi:hypothetical protein